MRLITRQSCTRRRILPPSRVIARNSRPIIRATLTSRAQPLYNSRGSSNSLVAITTPATNPAKIMMATLTGQSWSSKSMALATRILRIVCEVAAMVSRLS